MTVIYNGRKLWVRKELMGRLRPNGPKVLFLWLVDSLNNPTRQWVVQASRCEVIDV